LEGSDSSAGCSRGAARGAASIAVRRRSASSAVTLPSCTIWRIIRSSVIGLSLSVRRSRGLVHDQAHGGVGAFGGDLVLAGADLTADALEVAGFLDHGEAAGLDVAVLHREVDTGRAA